MHKFLLSMILALGVPLYAQTVTVEGNVENPDGSPFTGTFQVSLTRSSVVNTCVSPAQVVPFPGLTIKSVNGVHYSYAAPAYILSLTISALLHSSHGFDR